MLQAGDVDNVYDLWSREAERLLVQLAQRQGHHVEKGSSRRGHPPVFQEQHRHPPVLHEQASTLQSRRIWKAVCRAREVTVARPGFRRDKTWGYLARVLDSLGRDVREELEPLLRQTVDRSIAIRATELLEAALRRAQVQENSARIQCWKRALRAAPSAPYNWLRCKAKPAPGKTHVGH